MNVAEQVFLGNELGLWAGAVAAALVAFLLLRLVVRALQASASVLAGRAVRGAAVMLRLLRRLNPAVLAVVAVHLGSRLLVLPAAAEGWAHALLVGALTVQAGIWCSELITAWLDGYQRRHAVHDPAGVTTMRSLATLLRVVLVFVVILVGLDNVPGVSITAMVTSLGIGGVAVALAVQNILGDIFASVSITVDKPFILGDFVIVGDLMGTVEHIGLKTTRLRSLSGEQLVFSNSDLLNSRIRNFKRMVERRILFRLGVVYGTPVEKLEAIPRIVREIVAAQPKTRFDRAHFAGYGAYSLDFEIVYFLASADYNEYMDTQERVNLAIYRAFAAEGLEFAYPTQTVLVAGEKHKA